MGIQILIVDDVPSAARIVRKLLHNGGFTQVFDVPSGAAALEALKLEAIDLVIIDYNLRDMSGSELISLLRQDVTYEELPCLVISSDLSAAELAAVTAFGNVAYLAKPFTSALLLGKIEGLMGCSIDELK